MNAPDWLLLKKATFLTGMPRGQLNSSGLPQQSTRKLPRQALGPMAEGLINLM